MLPLLANEFVWREAPEHLQTTREIIGGDEVCEMLPELVVRLVVETFDGRLLDRPIHPLDLTVRPWVTWFGQAVLDIEIGTGQFKGMAAEQDFFGTHRLISSGVQLLPDGSVKCVPLSVITVWIRYGTEAASMRRKSPATRRVAFSCSSTNANFDVLSIATNR